MKVSGVKEWLKNLISLQYVKVHFLFVSPTNVQWWAFIITEDYGSKGSNV